MWIVLNQQWAQLAKVAKGEVWRRVTLAQGKTIMNVDNTNLGKMLTYLCHIREQTEQTESCGKCTQLMWLSVSTNISKEVQREFGWVWQVYRDSEEMCVAGSFQQRLGRYHRAHPRTTYQNVSFDFIRPHALAYPKV